MVRALQVLAGNNVELADSFRLFLILNSLLGALLLISRFVPAPLRVVQVAAAPARQQIAIMMQRNISQRAANDELFTLIQQVLSTSRALRRAA